MNRDLAGTAQKERVLRVLTAVDRARRRVSAALDRMGIPRKAASPLWSARQVERARSGVRTSLGHSANLARLGRVCGSRLTLRSNARESRTHRANFARLTTMHQTTSHSALQKRVSPLRSARIVARS